MNRDLVSLQIKKIQPYTLPAIQTHKPLKALPKLAETDFLFIFIFILHFHIKIWVWTKCANTFLCFLVFFLNQ